MTRLKTHLTKTHTKNKHWKQKAVTIQMIWEKTTNIIHLFLIQCLLWLFDCCVDVFMQVRKKKNENVFGWFFSVVEMYMNIYHFIWPCVGKRIFNYLFTANIIKTISNYIRHGNKKRLKYKQTHIQTHNHHNHV